MAANLSAEPHLTWVDFAKGLGISLVVFGHTLRGLIHSNVMTWTSTTSFVDAWIYAFHMPLFFFLSGLFLFRSKEKPWKEFIWDKIRGLAYPYFVWSAVTLFIKTAVGTAANQPYSVSDFTFIFYKP